jgi:hypothetical protein
MKSVVKVNPISDRIMKINQPQNKIVDRLKAQMKCDSVSNPSVAYSRMHSRHNRS